MIPYSTITFVYNEAGLLEQISGNLHGENTILTLSMTLITMQKVKENLLNMEMELRRIMNMITLRFA